MANKPIKTIRVGNGVSAQVWENTSKDGGTWLSVTITRSYKDGDKYKDSTSFRRDDLLFVSKAADMAFRWAFRKDQRDHMQSRSA